jgi:chitinase
MFLALYIFITAQLAWAALPVPPISGRNSGVASPIGYPIPTGTGTASSYPPNTPPGWPRSIVATSWYAGWHSDNFTLQDVSWSKYTSLIYAFA